MSEPETGQKIDYLYILDALAAGILIVLTIYAPWGWEWKALAWASFLGTRG